MNTLLTRNPKDILIFGVVFITPLLFLWISYTALSYDMAKQILNYLAIFILFGLVITQTSQTLNNFIIPFFTSRLFAKEAAWDDQVFYIEPVSIEKSDFLINALRIVDHPEIEDTSGSSLSSEFLNSSFHLAQNNFLEGKNEEPQMPPLFIPGKSSTGYESNPKETTGKSKMAIKNSDSSKKTNPYLPLAQQICIANEITTKTIYIAARKTTRQALSNYIFKKSPSVSHEISKLLKRSLR